MTDGSLQVEILSSDGGIQQQVKITDSEDLQHAIEALKLAAKYELGEDIVHYADPEEDEEEVENLRDKVAEVRDLVESNTEALEERISYLDSDVQELNRDIDGLQKDREISEKLDEEEDSEGETDDVDRDNRQLQDDQEDEEPDDAKSESLLEELELPEIVEQEEVETNPPYSYEEFKDLSKVEKQVAIYEAVRSIQPATKKAVANEVLDQYVTNSNSKEAQYIGRRLENQMSPHLERQKRERSIGKEPWEYAEDGYEFNDEVDPATQRSEDPDKGNGEVSDSIERNAEAMVRDAPEPDEDTADNEDSTDDIEWKSIREAVGEYEEDSGLKHLINREYKKSYSSTMMAQSFASTNDAEDWAAVEELPEEFRGGDT